MKAVKWEPWPYLVQTLTAFETHKEVIVLKARQLGLSWLVCGYCLWKAIFNDNVRVLMLSQGESEAWDLVAKCKFIWRWLPDFLKPSAGHDSRGWLEFPELASEIRALPSTEKAGRSTDATIVVMDEKEQHPYARENFIAIGPTIDAGGQSIEISTIEKMNLDSHFQERYKQARGGENNAFPVFLGWKLRPVREEGMTLESWFEERVRRKYTPWQIEQEYPESEEQAMAPPKVRAFFDPDATDALLMDVHEPIQHPLSAQHKSVNIYKPPVVGMKYCIFTDPSDGKEDPHATIVMDWATGDIVATSHAKMTADYVAQTHHDLTIAYNHAYNCYELNALAGGKFEETINNLSTPNVHKQKRSETGKPHPGWWTSRQVKKDMLYGLEEAIRNRLIRIHNRECINELKMFMMPESGDPCAPRGGHDDWVIALAGCWAIRKEMPTGIVRVTSFRYKDS